MSKPRIAVVFGSDCDWPVMLTYVVQLGKCQFPYGFLPGSRVCIHIDTVRKQCIRLRSLHKKQPYSLQVGLSGSNRAFGANAQLQTRSVTSLRRGE